MQYAIKAIETHYNGVAFRSRLEAKWAAMFDLLGWQWTYEPTDFNGWLPDFAIWGKTLVYVEVKPVVEFPQDVADQIDASGCSEEVLIVGIRGPVRQGPTNEENPSFGWLREPCYRYCSQTDRLIAYGSSWGKAVLGRWDQASTTEKYEFNQIGFCHDAQGFNDRITGGYDGGCYGYGDADFSEVEMLWREAGNRIQWKRK